MLFVPFMSLRAILPARIVRLFASHLSNHGSRLCRHISLCAPITYENIVLVEITRCVNIRGPRRVSLRSTNSQTYQAPRLPEKLRAGIRHPARNKSRRPSACPSRLGDGAPGVRCVRSPPRTPMPEPGPGAIGSRPMDCPALACGHSRLNPQIFARYFCTPRRLVPSFLCQFDNS
jgi:hypothetical protein